MPLLALFVIWLLRKGQDMLAINTFIIYLSTYLFHLDKAHVV